MPDQDGKLSPEESETALGFISSHWRGNRACPFCGATSWTLANRVFKAEPFVTTPGMIMLTGGVSFPFLALVCANCGYVYQFSAVIAKVVESTAKQPTTAMPAPEPPAAKEGGENG